MKSHSEPDLTDIGKWPWSIVPTRAFGDKRLSDADRRVLGALCAFVNRAGVCWPSAETLSDLSGYATRKSVIDAISRLKRAGYVRQLKPKDYQVTASGWKTNRYQVLWLGDEALPGLEDIQTARPLQDDLGRAEGHEEIGGMGEHDASLPLAHSLAHAYAHAIERVLGQPRRVENELAAARTLAAQGVTVAQVIEATEAHARACLARRAGVPALADVARAMS